MTQTLRWQKLKYSPKKRQLEIFGIALKLALSIYWDRLIGNNQSRHRHRRATWLVQQLLELGPTFIKIGQALSTRPDLIPIEYIEELSQLQDRVPEFEQKQAIAVIEEDLNNSIYALFREFDPVPIASASLGQVHKATLYTGEEVVIKVQRPGLAELFRLDFAVLEQLVGLANRFLPSTRKYDLAAVYQEFFELLYNEIDYIHEGHNADRFRANFASDTQIIVPKVYWRYTTKRVLTMEYLPGIKIDDRQSLIASKIDTDAVIRLGICSYLKQLLLDGFFQSDPHPGNMAVAQDGRLIFYDFGTMAEVQSMAKDQMIRTFFAVLRKDTDEVVDTLVYMGLIEPMGDMTPVRRLVAFLLEKFRDKPVDIKAFEQIGSEIYLMFEQQPFRLPAQMTFIIKALTTLDGIARALDPQYNLLAAAQPFIKSLTVASNNGNFIGALARQTKNFITYQLTKPSAAEIAIRGLESRIETGELQFRVRSLEMERALRRIYLVLKSILFVTLTGFSFIAGMMLVAISKYGAIACFSLSGLWTLFLIRSLFNLAIRERLDQLAK